VVRIVAPGLPTWPKLLFDSKRRLAKVSFRHATWQSHEWGRITATILLWCVTASWGVLLWNGMPSWELPVRIGLVLLGLVIVHAITKVAMPASLTEFLARQLFATRTTIWYAPHAIAIRGRLYERPVIVWRAWRDQVVQIRFIVQSDPDAERQIQQPLPQRPVSGQPKPIGHFREARLLEMVITTTGRDRARDFSGQGSLVRSIPITEINIRAAARVTVVCNAAATLTAPRQSQARPKPSGIDIDRQ
jgi:hypothetical protein